MALSTEQNIFGISDAKIAPVSTNTSASYAKDSYIDLPELNSVEVTVTSETKDCKAGLTFVDSTTIKSGYDVKFENVNIPLDVIALINGATLTQSGEEPNQINTLVESSSDVPALFNLAFKTNSVNGDPADFHMELYCVKGLVDIVAKSDDYWTCTFTGKAFARKSDKQFRAITANETAVAIS